jgi:DNA-binding Lrp family transcriptional regulator
LLRRIYESEEVVASGKQCSLETARPAQQRGRQFTKSYAPCQPRGPCLAQAYLLDWRPSAAGRTEARMVPFFVQIKCQLGKSYEVANKLADAELASEIYSTAGDYDLLVKFYVEDKTDIGHFVNEKVQTIPGIQDTHTIITFKAF